MSRGEKGKRRGGEEGRPVAKGIEVVELAHQPGFGGAPMGGEGVVQAGEERRIGVKVVIVKVRRFIKRAAIGFARAAISGEEGVANQRFDSVIEGMEKFRVHVRAEFTAEGVEHDRGVLAGKTGEAFDFEGSLRAKKFGHLREPEWELHP